ncbi:membrane-spanning 4-domains subfamily A member 10 [Dromiciops gliroides]|uniref:membrane-spanning 4-domains subfamily A member 10 n=1 Tax=Dromiciops gliroides TaxID=33562 RepID=UPI001CC3ADAF|nr:membrane-spanning 4-domains subfamily A member 10 [Dromiciops gliroides]
MAAGGEKFYVATGGVRGQVVAAAMISPEEKSPSQKWMLETSPSGSFLQEDIPHRIRRKAGPLTELGAFQIVNALLHIILGSYLVTAVKNIHLVAMKSWYPFWGAFFFLCSGALLIIMDAGSNMKLKPLTTVMSIINCFCALCGICVFFKDLFWECPFEAPVWRPYPTSTVHLQRLELALLIFSSLEFFAFICAMILLCKTELSSQVMDGISVGPLPLESTVDPITPPPTYEEVINDGKKEKAEP